MLFGLEASLIVLVVVCTAVRTVVCMVVSTVFGVAGHSTLFGGTTSFDLLTLQDSGPVFVPKPAVPHAVCFCKL